MPSRTQSLCRRRRAGCSCCRSQCIYVGDDERDIRAGKAAGMPTVAARYGYLGFGADVASIGARMPRFLLPCSS